MDLVELLVADQKELFGKYLAFRIEVRKLFLAVTIFLAVLMIRLLLILKMSLIPKPPSSLGLQMPSQERK
jgi:hypothetical protein